MDEYLFVDELKEEFNESELITTNELVQFYKSKNNNVKRNTVGWYIHKLKDMGILEHVSRGNYILSGSKYLKNKTKYMVILIDIIDSSENKNFDEKIAEKVEEINQQIVRKTKHKKNIDFNLLKIYKGDELQIVYPFEQDFGLLLINMMSILYPYKIRYSLGIGYIDEMKEDPWEMNGPIFWNARDGLKKIEELKDYSGSIITGDKNKDYIISSLIPLLDISIRRITDKQWEAIRISNSGMEVEEILNILKITKSSYYERLKVSNIEEIKKYLLGIYNLIEMEEFNA